MPSPFELGARVCIGSLLLVVGCANEHKLTREELMDPKSCETCHPNHYREWSGSMHAYAGDSPMFLATLTRGQRETSGALGDLCVRCHAPMAREQNLTFDGQNLPELPSHMRGVTCYFCHVLESVDGPVLAQDNVLRAAIQDPVSSGAHASGYSPLRDRNRVESSDMCAICHPNTFREWQASVFGYVDNPRQHLSCGKCHMTGQDGLAAEVNDVPVRRVHEHTFAGVDVAVTPWPEKQAQLVAIQRDLDPSLIARLCVKPGDVTGVIAEVTLDNVIVGHMFPSGVPRNRRAWVEIVAYLGSDVVYQSGQVAGDQPVLGADPDVWVLREWHEDMQGQELRMPWQSGTVHSDLLPPAVTNDPNDPRYNHSRTTAYEIAQLPTRITLRVRLRPIGLDLVDDLIGSQDLDPRHRTAVPTFDLLGTNVEWELGQGLPSCSQ